MTLVSDFITTLKESEDHHIPRKEVLHMLHLIHEGYTKEVVSIQRGDVFWAKVVGGKNRPWVVLSCREGLACAVAISSSNSAPRMVKSACRFWPDNWIGTTVSLFEETDVRKSVAHPYTNRDHLREIEAHVASLMDLRKLPGGTRSIDVPDAKESRQVVRAKKRAKMPARPSRTPDHVAAMNGVTQ